MSHIAQVITFLNEFLSHLPHRPFAIRLPNGQLITPHPPTLSPDFTIVLHRPSILRRILFPPNELAVGEGYIFNDFDIEGNIVAAMRFIEGLKVQLPSTKQLLKWLKQLREIEKAELPTPAANEKFNAYNPTGNYHTQTRDQSAIRFAYDVSNEFYRLWLDQRMTYSCAYFDTANESLEKAQERKLDLICRKLDLQPGEQMLDIGCGWGALAIYAATHYQVQVTGITLSDAQQQEATARIHALGLQDRCQIKVCHYQAMETDTPFDKLSSIGMIEHVGKERLANYFQKASQLLKNRGRFLLQGGYKQEDRRHLRHWQEWLGIGRNAFMHKYSFPDSDLPVLERVIIQSENSGFEVREVESLREHYPLTIQHWLSRLEQGRDKAVAELGEVAYRAWRIMMAGYLHLLEKGDLSEYQVLFTKGRVNHTHPWKYPVVGSAP